MNKSHFDLFAPLYYTNFHLPSHPSLAITWGVNVKITGLLLQLKEDEGGSKERKEGRKKYCVVYTKENMEKTYIWRHIRFII